DHVLDLAVAARSDNVVSVLLGKGDGTFQPRVDYAAANASAVAVADFNQDGKADLAVAGGFSGGVVGFLKGKGDGTFQPAVGYPAGHFLINSLASGDFNGDGEVDLLVVSTPVSVLLGNGD